MADGATRNVAMLVAAGNWVDNSCTVDRYTYSWVRCYSFHWNSRSVAWWKFLPIAASAAAAAVVVPATKEIAAAAVDVNGVQIRN